MPRPSGPLEEIRLIDLIRDYPETLGILLEAGVDLQAQGALPLAEVPGGDELEERINAALVWRADPGSG